jgi:hypothetical protein
VRTTNTLLAIAFALPLSAVAVAAVVTEVADQIDPCVRWNSDRIHPAPSVCTEIKVRGETRGWSFVRMAAVPGVILAAGVLAVFGALRKRPWLIFLAACLILVEVVPLALTLWPPALLTRAGFLYVANRTKVSWTGSS